jgi:hypothetical protein
VRFLNRKKAVQISKIINPLGHGCRGGFDMQFILSQVLLWQSPRLQARHVLAD